ncbi:hypothetical protein KCU75_g59, partial [Aureobasidium melanogenum]
MSHCACLFHQFLRSRLLLMDICFVDRRSPTLTRILDDWRITSNSGNVVIEHICSHADWVAATRRLAVGIVVCELLDSKTLSSLRGTRRSVLLLGVVSDCLLFGGRVVLHCDGGYVESDRKNGGVFLSEDWTPLGKTNGAFGRTMRALDTSSNEELPKNEDAPMYPRFVDQHWLRSALSSRITNRYSYELLLLLVEESVGFLGVDEQVRLAEASLGFSGLFGLVAIRRGVSGRRAAAYSISIRFEQVCSPYFSAGVSSLVFLLAASLFSTLDGGYHSEDAHLREERAVLIRVLDLLRGGVRTSALPQLEEKA